jgi:hypothetical protein
VSFSCPHFRPEDEACLRLDADCVPGRPGCVLGSKAVFAVPVEQRLHEKEDEKRHRTAKRWMEQADAILQRQHQPGPPPSTEPPVR